LSTQDRPRLYLNHIFSLDWLVALEFGRIDDGQPPENWRGVSEQFGYMHEHENGPCVGFEVLGFSDFDPEAEEVAQIWDGPCFTAPQLGLSDVVAGEIVVAARAFFGDLPSVNRFFFEAGCTS
jgi:hypothetical protein